jgi:hypothetical protein
MEVSRERHASAAFNSRSPQCVERAPQYKQTTMAEKRDAV